MKIQYFQHGVETVRNAPQLYVDLDVEADGKPGYGSLLSVGAVSPFGDEFYSELRPTSEIWVPSQRDFCENHGLERRRLIDEGKEPEEVMSDLANWIIDISRSESKKGAVMVAFNASFDFPWIDLEMYKAGIKNPMGVAGYCIKSLAQKLNNDYDWQKTSKNKLPSDVVPDGDFTHNALEDAKYQQKMHYAMVGKLFSHEQ